MRAALRASRLCKALAGAGLVSALATAHAGLFDDDEARKAILDLRNRFTQIESKQADEAAQASQLKEQVQQLQRALLDANNQLEQLRSDVARLRGQNEQLTKDVADVQRRQKDIAQGVDDRIRRLEPQKVNVDGKEFMADPEERRVYEDAIAPIRNGDFNATASALQSFVRRFPASGYIDSARFWLGNAQYGKREYREAIGSFKAFINGAPDHPRAPEAMLAIANCEVEMRDNKAARKTLSDLIRVYPKSEAAQAAKERMASLK